MYYPYKYRRILECFLFMTYVYGQKQFFPQNYFLRNKNKWRMIVKSTCFMVKILSPAAAFPRLPFREKNKIINTFLKEIWHRFRYIFVKRILICGITYVIIFLYFKYKIVLYVFQQHYTIMLFLLISFTKDIF